MFLPGIKGLDFGWIVVNSGNMFGGKTERLMSQIDVIKRSDQLRKDAALRTEENYNSLSIGVFKHAIDIRYDNEEVASHNGKKVPAIPVNNVEELIGLVEYNNFRVIGIDEIQFFEEIGENQEYKILHALKRFTDDNRYVISSGLDKDFRGLPFGPMGDILAMADEITQNFSLCAKCGAEATLTQRLINGLPPKFDDPIVLVGSNESYEPRCRLHHEVLS